MFNIQTSQKIKVIFWYETGFRVVLIRCTRAYTLRCTHIQITSRECSQSVQNIVRAIPFKIMYGGGNFENTRKNTRHYIRTAKLHTELYLQQFIQYYILHSEKNLRSPHPPAYTILHGIALSFCFSSQGNRNGPVCQPVPLSVWVYWTNSVHHNIQYPIV